MNRRIIKNYQKLSTNKLRKDALNILEAGLKAVSTKEALEKVIDLNKNFLKIKEETFNLAEFSNIYLIAIGKAAGESAKFLEKKLGKFLKEGIVLDLKNYKFKKLQSLVGDHPLPTLKNVENTKIILSFLRKITSKDLLIFVTSGGASALFSQPKGIDLNLKNELTKDLIKNGASIFELNTVRKHLSGVKGGFLAKLLPEVKTINLIFSDVLGNDLSMVASGPLIKDESQIISAQKILEKYNFNHYLEKISLQETPKEDKIFSKIKNILVVSSCEATLAMSKEAKKLGYIPIIYSNEICGEACSLGPKLSIMPQKGEVIIGAGETTVKVKGCGQGGRNQEVALSACENLPKDVLVLSCASDGFDNTNVAGALVDKKVLDFSKKRGLDFKKFLKNNDSYNFFKETGSYIYSGLTGINVADIFLAIRSKK